ncbi:rRNA biogenesis protein rrp5 [Caproicibacterium amylolyticum]|uniref:rRNA biogenesis protein rrp5 n=1 Tax=Caproicibacterium amylolyticum TaxID=2766537 RepID=A0A7G9WGU5_9FIRM|nr:rRNA biogenesis protein rrp5 [Caproicibacterium amylolyticum]QNO17907.1 rRNA biogenesis protein rrp5 [Caproicibacterium amylolyticum]
MEITKLLLNVVFDLRKLADSVQAIATAMADTGPAEQVQPESPVPAVKPKLTEKTVTLEKVRAVLADKSHDGFTAEVRALLEKHGAKKLSEIEPVNYAALLSDAEELK